MQYPIKANPIYACLSFREIEDFPLCGGSKTCFSQLGFYKTSTARTVEEVVMPFGLQEKNKMKEKAAEKNVIAEAYNPEFKRTLDKTQISTCNIMGVNIAAINMEWLCSYVQKNLKALSGDYICVSNVHTTVTAYEDPEYLKVQNGGIMAIPDGGPLSFVGHRRGFEQMERTTGPSFMEEVLKVSAEKGYRHYFYGSTPETLEKLNAVLLHDYPGIQIAGMYSPPFRPLTDEEDSAIVDRINEVEADFVWIGLGAPKQEKWMAQHQGAVNGVMVGVGAGFDYFAGNIDRAPEWMQKSNLEWVYRLMQDPKRLFSRYFHTNTKFIWNAVVRGK